MHYLLIRLMLVHKHQMASREEVIPCCASVMPETLCLWGKAIYQLQSICFPFRKSQVSPGGAEENNCLKP